MTSTHDHEPAVDRDVDYYREELQIAVTALQACDAALRVANDNLEHGIGHRPGGSDQLRIAEASDALRRLLALPTDRPGSWEAEAVAKLQEPLRDVLAVLEGGDR